MVCDSTTLQTTAAPITPKDHDAANSGLGFRFVRALACQNACSDPRLSRGDLHVLAAIVHHMNDDVKRAWPGYHTICDLTGLSEIQVRRNIGTLVALGYLFSERKALYAGGRAIARYGLCSVPLFTMDGLEEAIAAWAAEQQHRRSDKREKRHSGVVTVSPRDTVRNGTLKADCSPDLYHGAS